MNMSEFNEQRDWMNRNMGKHEYHVHHGVVAFSGATTAQEAEHNLKKVISTGADFEICASSTTRIGYAGISGIGIGYRFPTDVLSEPLENGKRIVDENYFNSLVSYMKRTGKSFSTVYEETREAVEEERRIMGYSVECHDEVIVSTTEFNPTSLWVRKDAPTDIQFVMLIMSLNTGLPLERVGD